METTTLDKLHLEWSQFTSARTARELAYADALGRLARLSEEGRLQDVEVPVLIRTLLAHHGDDKRGRVMNDRAIAKSWVYHDLEDQWYFVSTIYRDSSAAVSPPPRYAETIAWEWHPSNWKSHGVFQGDRGKVVAETGCSCFEGIVRHGDVCAQLSRTGKYEEPDDASG